MHSLMEYLHSINHQRVIQIALMLGFVVALYSILRLTVLGVGKRLQKRARSTPNLINGLAADLLCSTRGYFLFALSIYVGSLFASFSDRIHTIFEKSVIFVLLFQLLIWSKIAIDFWIENYLKKADVNDKSSATTLGLISFSIRALVFTIVILLALNNLGVDITAVIAGLGVGGIAVALALQNILGDLFASLTIVLDKPFVAGDFVVVGEFMGTIEHIGLKTTRLRSISGEQLVFANGDLLQSRIRNFKRMAERRIVLNLTVTYQTSETSLREIPAIAKRIIESQNSATMKVRFDRCHFLEFQDSALRFELVYWVLSAEFNVYADLAQEINIGIFEEFKKAGIEFAYPTRTVYAVSVANSIDSVTHG